MINVNGNFYMQPFYPSIKLNFQNKGKQDVTNITHRVLYKCVFVPLTQLPCINKRWNDEVNSTQQFADISWDIISTQRYSIYLHNI